ncbi:MAG: hypothetical protein OHK0023_09270 [Anaerolineae bacterium]
MWRRIRENLLRRGVQTLLSSGAQLAATATARQFEQVFQVTFPVTVSVRASHARVTVHRTRSSQVLLQADLGASFGWEFISDQDEFGVYIVAKRKPLVGALSWASFSLNVPMEANLAFNLTPGAVSLEDVDGKFSLLGEAE